MSTLLVSSSGGHLYKTFTLKSWWGKHDRLWITPNNKMSRSLLKGERVVFSSTPDQRFNWLNLVRNFILALKIIKKQKPSLIFSTGSGVALPFFMIAKIFGIKTIFMETFIFIDQPTLTGKIIYYFKLSDIFLIQNKKMKKYYPGSEHWGSVL